MGIFASFLDLLWPSRKADPAPQPLPPIDFTAMNERGARAMRDLPAEIRQRQMFSGLRGGAVYEDLPASSQNPEANFAKVAASVGPDWKPWPPAQFAPEAEAKLKKLASSRTREPVQVKPWSKPVRTPLGEFGSVTEAAEAHGIARSTLHEYLAKGVEGWERLPKPMVTVKGTRKARRAVLKGLVSYPSVSAAARSMGRSTQTIHRWCKAGVRGWRYAD